MADTGALLAAIGGGLFQQAWVVPDLDRATEAATDTMGCGEFTRFVMAETFELRGRPVDCKLALGFARSGDLQLELMQPLEGEGIHFEFLAARGGGVHHLGALVDDLEAAVADARECGFAAVMTGQFASVRVSYIDTLDALGVYIELIEDPAGMLWATRPWRDHPVDR